MINAKTKLCCIIGNPVEHSLSPQIHNVAYQALGLNFIFLAFRVVDVKAAIAGFRACGIRGIVVTIPHKQEVMKYVDSIDETAKKIGAVNTIVVNESILKACNTDWIGALEALEEETKIDGKTVALIGAGGAARALAYALKWRGAKVAVFNRTKERANQLVAEFGLSEAFSLSEIGKIKEYEIIINTSSLGMMPNSTLSPVPKTYLTAKQVVFDIVYTPRVTNLLFDAKTVGAKVIYGDKMLLYGARRQFELFTGKKAPIKKMEAVLQRALK